MIPSIAELIDFEHRQVSYQEPLPGSSVGFAKRKGKGRVVVSAPHGARCYRPGDIEDYHGEDEYTAALADWLHRHLDLPAIYMYKRSATDPNYHQVCPYKTALRQLIEETHPVLVLDIHGAMYTRDFAVDVGTGGEEMSKSQQYRVLVNLFEQIWNTHCAGEKRVTFNRFPARSPRTVRSFVDSAFASTIPALQLEINGSFRIPRRKPDATNKSPFPYPAPSDVSQQEQRIMRLLMVLSAFAKEVDASAVP